ncbi:MAG: hypothetical protein HKM07_07445 [Chlamydiae bacterium]|nr:hypothetical protein [Chlamydiota bacterium]
MRWNFGETSHFRFISDNDGVYFEICLGNLPDIYSDFVSRVKNKFIENTNGESQQFIFSYKLKSNGTEEINIPQCFQEERRPDEYSYIVTNRRVFENASPRYVSQDELSLIIRNRNVLFYTGAGISLASGVPGMNELYNLLGLEIGEKFLFSLENALEKPREFASKILAFHKACLFSAPTKAHIALKELAIFKNVRLLTENLDCLHEASGVYPYRIDAKHLREEIECECLAQFDYIICIGLNYDDHGFLGWYKKCNPHGKIIAVDLQQPSYLGNEDFLVIGDLQEVIPSIQKKIVE